MPLRAIVYTSQIAAHVDESKRTQIVVDAGRFNRLAGVTGVLLFDGARFLQYFEGPQDGVDAVYARVKSSRSHVELLELASGRIGQRLFPYWGMHMIPVEAMDTSRLVAASWTDFDTTAPSDGRSSSGILGLGEVVSHHLPAGHEPSIN